MRIAYTAGLTEAFPALYGEEFDLAIVQRNPEKVILLATTEAVSLLELNGINYQRPEGVESKSGYHEIYFEELDEELIKRIESIGATDTPMLDELAKWYSEKPKDPAKLIVFSLIEDLRGRSGLDHEFDNIDSETQEEILREWIEKVRSILA